ncbi:Sin3 associated polypeptide p18-domain-containing protein [Multifurca ochricompacta]|uniref:Sin3 associated polypeptide p18-domain-containing protein n=1 Tax=Multifurca ochricompacta TaxID=376703 RepID=A0AAD4QNU9_9AGAM|nr:Sin3 associated polypeptide p18-domain-containing protein [Multifurca ochricompacta]
MEEKTPAGQPIIDREKTAPFLIRAFVKIGSFHRLPQFQDGPLPIADELQIFTWKDATLFELLTTIRNSAPNTLEYRHPLARYSFALSTPTRKDLGVVYSRDTLGDLGSVEQLVDDNDDDDNAAPDSSARQKDARTLDELRFVPGDYLCVAVMLPKNVQASLSGEGLSAKGGSGGALASSSSAAANGWKSGGGLGRGVNASAAGGGPSPGVGRGGGHWRGGSDAPPQPARSRGDRGGGEFSGGGRGDRDRDRDRDREGGGRFREDRDRRPPLPKRESPPPRGPRSDRDRSGRDRRSPSRSRSRSRSPPARRRR